MTKDEATSNDRMIKGAVEVLRTGGVVGFPTETVYGLGADARNSDAVRRVFELKGRPATNPLIVHVADEAVARRYARRWDGRAERLARRFWPGALTLVVEKAGGIVDEVTAGRATVGLRVPDHPLTLEMLRRFDGPVAGPSANRSNRVSPTTAQHVRDEFGVAVQVLDGGPCAVGIESTVLDLTQDRARILRPGGVSREAISAELGEPVELAAGVVDVSTPGISPGQHSVHYAPRTPAYRVRDWSKVTWPAGRAGVMSWREVNAPAVTVFRKMPAEADAYARELYRALREMDQTDLEALFVEMPPDTPQWTAVRDRLIRATREQ